MQAQHKKDKNLAVDKALDKLKVEMLNKISEFKNEQAKKEAEWQRERNRFNQTKEEAIELAIANFESKKADDIKEARLHVERIWKKKQDEK